MKTRKQSDSDSETPIIGQKMPLDADTPCGLFQSRGDDRFIVSTDPEYGTFAIVMRHRRQRLFAWQSLTLEPLCEGCWWGPYRIRLLTSFEPENLASEPGTIIIADGGAGMECLRDGGGTKPLPLGMVGELGLDHRDSECWTIEAARTPFAFCVRSRNGKMSYGSAPQFTTSDWDNDSFIELDPRSVLE